MKDHTYTRRPSDIFPTGVFELKVSYHRRQEQRVKITNSADAADLAKSQLYEPGSIEYNESFFAIFMDRNNRVFAWKKISEGGQAGTVVDAKLVYQAALLSHAASIILCHNHPSGNVKPSDADIRLTKNLVEAGKVLELPVLDHVIVAVNGFFSFADEGLM